MNFAGLVRLSFELDPNGSQDSKEHRSYATGRDIKGRGEQTKDCQGYVESRNGSYVYT